MIQISALVAAVLSLTGGLGLHLWAVRHPTDSPRQTSTIAWLLMAMTPVLVLFTVFPESTLDLRFKGVSATGAVALFLYIWHRGTRLVAKAAHLEQVEAQLVEANKKLEAERQREQSSRKVKNFDRHAYRLLDFPDRLIGIATGDLTKVSGFDIWTNSENTNMRMAGIYERSISATIRHLGSEVDGFGDPVEGGDTIMQELLDKMKGREAVEPHTVLVTGPGRLATTHQVKCILHVAASYRERGGRSQGVSDLEDCVWEALKKANSPDIARLGVRSILLPLFGTGQGGSDPSESIRSLFEMAAEYMRKQSEVSVTEVFFLAWSEGDLSTCRTVLQELPHVEPVTLH